MSSPSTSGSVHPHDETLSRVHVDDGSKGRVVGDLTVRNEVGPDPFDSIHRWEGYLGDMVGYRLPIGGYNNNRGTVPYVSWTKHPSILRTGRLKRRLV